MKYLFQLLILSLLLSSCNVFDATKVNPIDIISDPVVDSNSPFEKRSAYNTYSRINKQTSKSISQKYFPGDYLTKDFTESLTLGSWGTQTYYRFWGPCSTYLDYNEDGKLDLFGFLTDFGPESYGGTWGETLGKFFLIDDIESDTLDIRYYDAPFQRCSPEWEIGNFDNDDELEILVMSEDGHVRHDGSVILSNSLINLIDIDVNGDIFVNRFGHGTFSHQLTSGDVDNDGDLDIIYYLSDANVVHQTKGNYGMFQLLTNNGDGTFTENHPFDTFKNLQDSLRDGDSGYYYNWRMTTVELYDMNGDNNLDMITSITHDSCDDGDNIGTPLCKNNTQIYWGSGNGVFDMSNVTNLPNRYKELLDGQTYTYTEEFFPLSHSIFDYNNDGYMDLLSVIVKSTDETVSYDGFYVQIHRNNGSKTFTDVTPDIFDIYTHANITGDEFCYDFDFSDLYEYVPFDKDGDGDFDIVPNKVTTWDMACKVKGGTYFENDNGIFMLVQ